MTTSPRSLRRAIGATMVLAAFLAGGTAGPFAVDAQDAKPSPARAPSAQPPVRVSADAAEYLDEEGLVVFTGNVIAVQADSKLAADRMEVRFSQPGEGTAQPPPAGIESAAGGRGIAAIKATGKVSFRQANPETGQERYATGEHGVYDAGTRRVTLTGSPRLWDGKNVIVGEQMVFNLDDRKVVVNGRVNLTVYPDEAKEGRKP